MDIFEILAWVIGPIVCSMFIYFGIMGILRGKTDGMFRYLYRTLPSEKINNPITARITGVVYLLIGITGLIYMLQLIFEYFTTGNVPHILDY